MKLQADSKTLSIGYVKKFKSVYNFTWKYSRGQIGMNQLDKYGIKYNITKTYPNGVRIGNVPSHRDKRKAEESGQAWFPKSWTNKDIRRAGEHVAGLKGNRHIPDGKTVFGTYKGVRVGIMRTNGKIATIFPDSDQSKALKKRRKK